MIKKPRTYEATEARWKEPGAREPAAEGMRELHRRAKAAQAEQIEKEKEK